MDLEFCKKGSSFHGELKDAIRNMYPKLIIEEYNKFSDLVIDLINVIAIKFGFQNDNPSYKNQFKQNDYQDVKMISRLLLPYIDDASYQKRKVIKSFNELYTTKINKDYDLPKYKFSNIQYDRCKEISPLKYTETKFQLSDLDECYILAKRTIQLVSNKLFCNWINIRPLNIDTYKETILFKATDDYIKKNKYVRWLPDKYGITDAGKINDRNYKGLSIDTIYNVIINDLYYSVRRQKWLLYDVFHKDKLYPMITILGHLLPTLDYALRDYEWLEILEDDRKLFSFTWNKMIESALETNSSVNGIGSDIIKRLVRTIMIYFNKYFQEKEQISRQYNYVSFNLKKVLHDYDKDEIDENDLDIGNKREVDIDTQLQLMKESIETLPVQFIYTHIKNDLQQLKISYYGNSDYILNNEDTYPKFNTLDKPYPRVLPVLGYFTMKNIYNISKSLSHEKIDKDDWNELPKLFRGLTSKQREDFIKKINMMTPINEWLSLNRYINRLYGSSHSTGEKNTWYDMIFKTYLANLSRMVFDSLIKKGVLTQFVPNPELTDDKLLPKNKNKKVKVIKEKLYEQLRPKIDDNWGNCYYFLTNKKYKNMDKIKLKEGDYEYFRHITKNHDWFTMFAMDWVSQILFYHHYLNNRVMFMTGATGVGKSTQVPKLFAYALKMIDYKPNGKVLVTQPRIPPTVGVSTWISKELGVPIMKFSKNIQKDIKSNNYQVQYKFQGDSHTKTGCNHPVIKFLTDGTFIITLKDNILQKYQNKKYDRLAGKDLFESYGLDNTNDVIIVDEAHEHNTNMDLIITLCRYTAHYNNNIKFVILSATIDEDEPTYRRYFRGINDNLIYPIDELLEMRQIDRICVDRRFHISAPGESTRFPIAEYYRPKANPDDLVLEIIKKDDKGDILLFQPGVAEIDKSLKYLNERLPNNIIALPFHGQMQEESRDIISKLGEPKNRNKITLSKNNMTTNPINGLDTKQVSSGTYNRFVLVATNIAEASITIKTLKYVIDTGTQKTSVYSPLLRYSKLDPTYISDSSRLQRKGRVGRQAPGVVYYMYEEGLTEKIPTTFNISIEDCTEMLLNLLPTYGTEVDLLFEREQDPSLEEFKLLDREGSIEHSINKFLEFYYKKGNNKLYLGSDNNDRIYINPGSYLYSGFNMNTINDNDGSFYAIHPNERKFKRNILGYIVDINDDGTEVIPITKTRPYTINSIKIEDSWKQLQEMDLIDKYGRKTEDQIFAEFVKGKFMFPTYKETVTYLNSIKLGCDQQILHLLAMLSANNTMNKWYGLKTVIFRGKPAIGLAKDEFKKIYKTKMSDLESLLSIDYKFTNSYEWKLIKNHHGNVKDKWDNNKKQFRKWMERMTKVDRSEMDISRDIPQDIYDRLHSLMMSGKMTDEDKLSQFELDKLDFGAAIKKQQKKKIEDLESKLIKWARNNYVNDRSLYQYAIGLINYKFIHNNVIIKSKEYKKFIKDNTIHKSNPSSPIETIIKCFIKGYGFQIVKKIRRTPFYVNINRVNSLGVTWLNQLTQKDTRDDSCIYPKSEILLYISQNHNDGSVSVMSNIYPLTLKELNYEVDSINERELSKSLKLAATKEYEYLKQGLPPTYSQVLADIKRISMITKR